MSVVWIVSVVGEREREGDRDGERKGEKNLLSIGSIISDTKLYKIQCTLYVISPPTPHTLPIRWNCYNLSDFSLLSSKFSLYRSCSVVPFLFVYHCVRLRFIKATHTCHAMYTL